MIYVKVSFDCDPKLHLKNLSFYSRAFDGLGLEADCGDFTLKIQPGTTEAEIRKLYEEAEAVKSVKKVGRPRKNEIDPIRSVEA